MLSELGFEPGVGSYLGLNVTLMAVTSIHLTIFFKDTKKMNENLRYITLLEQIVICGRARMTPVRRRFEYVSTRMYRYYESQTREAWHAVRAALPYIIKELGFNDDT